MKNRKKVEMRCGLEPRLSVEQRENNFHSTQAIKFSQRKVEVPSSVTQEITQLTLNLLVFFSPFLTELVISSTRLPLCIGIFSAFKSDGGLFSNLRILLSIMQYSSDITSKIRIERNNFESPPPP